MAQRVEQDYDYFVKIVLISDSGVGKSNILSMSKEVPWFLDDGTSRVNVVGACGATGFALTVGSEVFEESGRSLVRGTLDYLQGLKMLGVKRIERVLLECR